MKPLSAMGHVGSHEDRRVPREPPTTRENAHAIVEAIASRKPENARSVRRWRFVKQAIYLLLLVGAYLFYYFIDTLIEAMSLPGLGF